MADTSRCPRCGAAASSARLSGMCPSCLLELALLPPADGEAEGGDEDAPMSDTAYRVVTILAADEAGTTYLAEQEQTRRLVTLHVVALPADDEQQRLFGERVSGLRRLRHPAIQAVLEGRRTRAGDGCVVAAYVNGPQLLRYCQSPRVDGAARASLFSQVCEAIAYAHAQGVWHGRLRPEYVVVSQAGEAAVPVVLGFSAVRGAADGFETDLAGLEMVARAMGWAGASPDVWSSIEALRQVVCRDWEGG